MTQQQRGGPILAAGTLLGIGLGGFIDGIVLHQILQWHNMISNVVAPVGLVSMKINMVWDGVFHLFTWAMTLAGVIALWNAGRQRDVPWSTPLFAGAMTMGWGLFNVVEGILDHHVLGLHHVHPGANELAWDVGFLLFGVALILAGLMLIRRGSPRVARWPQRGGSLIST